MINNPSMANQVQIFLAAGFTLSQAQSMRSSNPSALILNDMNAEETVAGLPSAPDSYFLKDTNGNKIQDWPGTPGNFILNLTNPQVATFVAQYANQQLSVNGFQYDGIFFDNVITQISTKTTDCFGNPIQIDSNGDGLPDDPATLDANWSAGVFSMISQFHAMAPNALISGHVNQVPPDPRALAGFNGGSLGFDVAQVRDGILPFGTLYDAYQTWMSQSLAPPITAVQSSPPMQIAYGYGYNPLATALPSTAAFGQTFYPNMRFGLAVALMGDGFFSFDDGDSNSATAWWYDDYNFNLGQSVAPPVQIGAAPSSNVIQNSGFETGTSPWLFQVAHDGISSATFGASTVSPADGAASAHINVAAVSPQPWNVDLEQDNLSLVSGQEYVLQFWARASAPRTMPITLQGGPPAYKQYGLQTTLSLDNVWRLYNISVVSNSTATDGRLEFWFGAATGDIWLDDITMTTAPTRIYRRDYTNGIAIVNGTTSPQTIPLEAGLRKFTSNQSPKYQYIVDDADLGFSTTGTWIVDNFDTGFRTANPPYYHAWKSNCHEMDSGGGTAQWNLGISEDGQYTIQVWLPSPPVSSTWTKSAVYEVMSGLTVIASATIDQSQASGGDQWYTVANVNLTAAGAPYLRVRNTGSGPLIADAVYVYSTTAKLNDGSNVSQVNIAPMDGILLQRTSVNQTISFPAVPTQAAGGPPVQMNASVSSGLPVTYIANSPSICPLSNGTVTPLTTGSCSVTATQPGTGNYTAAVPVTQTFLIGSAQSISFLDPTSESVGSTVGLSATASSGLPVAFASNSPSICTISGTSANLLATGVCSVVATQNGNSTWAPAPAVIQTFNALSTQTITFSPPGPQANGDAPFPLNVSSSSGLPVTVVTLTPSVCTVSGTIVRVLATGTCTLTASQNGNASVSPAPPTTQSFPIVANMITNGGFENPAIAPWVFNVPSNGSAAGTAALTSAAFDGANAMLLTVTVAGSSSSLIDLEQGGMAVVTGRTYRVKFWARADSARSIDVYLQGASSPYPVYGLQSTINLTTSWALYTFPFVASATASDGRLEFRVANATGNIWLDDVQLLWNIPSTQTINFVPPGTQAIGATNVPINATATSGLTVTLTSNTTSICTVSGLTATMLTEGTCSITATQPGVVGFYAAPPVTQTFTVLPGQSITVTPISTQTIGTAPFAINATASSGLAVIYGSATANTCQVSGSNLSLLAPGPCTVTYNQAGDASFAPALAVTQTFTILATQTITFPAPAPQGYGTGPLVLAATASSALTVSYASGTTTTCTVSGNSVALLAIGACTITASQPGNAAFAAALPITVSFGVVAGPQTITFNAPANQTYSAGSIAISATSSSGLPVSFNSGSTSICVVSGSTVSFVAAGTCSITATQAGNSNFNPATPVTRTFKINTSTQVITFAPLPSRATGGKPVALVASASSGLPVVFKSNSTSICALTGNNLNVLAPGTCSISADQYGNANYMGAPEVTQTFAVKANLLSNGGFENTMTPWQFLLSNDGKVAASASIDTTKFADGVSSLLVTVTSAATSAWHVDVEQQNLPVTAGVTYQVQFWAIANATRTMNVVMQGGAPNYTNYGLNASVTVGTTWQPYTLTFVAPVSATDGRLEFWFGASAGNAHVDDVQFFAP